MVTAAMVDQSLPSKNSVVDLHPPAKINLSLVVASRRPDGFHNIHTVMAAVSLYDDLRISIAPSPGINLRCTGRPVLCGPENLVYKAAQMLSHYARVPLALDISLHKRIPIAAGLGGASSDAAYCLLGLNRLWGLNLSRDTLAGLAADLGSDVPFFLFSPVALCTGRGEIVQSLPQRCRRSILLIMPDIQVPTAKIYQHYVFDKSAYEDNFRRVRYFLDLGDLDSLLEQGINSLAKTCMERFEPLRQLRRRIEDLGIAPVHISGSGSTLFVTSHDPAQIEQWAQLIQQHHLAEVQIVSFQDQAESFLEVQHANIGN